MVKLLQGVGINDADYKVTTYYTVDGKIRQKMCPIYQKWKGMLSRCYSEKIHSRSPTYSGCSVERSWLKFSNFRSWVITQDWKGKHPDKDILGDGKLYSQDTCCFISQELNKFLTLRGNDRGDLPVGVSKSGRKFRVQVSNPNTKKSEYLGTYETEGEALLNWKRGKLKMLDGMDLDSRMKSAIKFKIDSI